MPHETDIATLDSIACLVREDDPVIDSIWLPGDGHLQIEDHQLGAVCSTLAGYLRDGFRGRRHDEFPMHICAWGKAHAGSPAPYDLFGLAGVPSYYQPVKSALRTLFAGEAPAPWNLPTAERQPHIFSKETQGPYSLGECLFISLRVLIEAGYPPDRLHLIIVEHDPASVLASWLSRLAALQTQERLLHHCIIAALNVNRVRRYARRHGVPVTHYVHEAGKEPLGAARALFRRLGISRRVEPLQAAGFERPGLYGSDSADGGRVGATTVADEHRRMLEEAGVYRTYRQAVAACIRDLDLDVWSSGKSRGETGSVVRLSARAGSCGM